MRSRSSPHRHSIWHNLQMSLQSLANETSFIRFEGQRISQRGNLTEEIVGINNSLADRNFDLKFDEQSSDGIQFNVSPFVWRHSAMNIRHSVGEIGGYSSDFASKWFQRPLLQLSRNWSESIRLNAFGIEVVPKSKIAIRFCWIVPSRIDYLEPTGSS
jgi:hypothetical protein